MKAWTETYTKRIVTIIVINSIGWIWASYVLAYLGKTDIAEDLASKVVTAILGTVITYCLKSLFENISEKGYKGKQEEHDTVEDIRRDI